MNVLRKFMCYALAALILAAAVPLSALAEVMLGDVIYGPWSEWVYELPENADNLVTESREGTRQAVKTSYTYRRYEYFNLKRDMWYATNTDEVGETEKPGSGRWTEKTFDKKLEQIGIVNREKCYEGQWFDEQIETADMGEEKVTEYRYRTKTTVRCILSEKDAAIARGSKYELKFETADPGKIWFKTTNARVATVDTKGVVTGKDIGSCEIWLMIGGERVAKLNLHVGQLIAGLAAGSYSIQLIGTDEYLAPIGGVPKAGVSLFTSNYIPKELRYFRFMGVDSNAFRVRLVSPQMLYLSVRESDNTVGLYGRTNKLEQSFSILRLKGGQDLICASDDMTQFLAVSQSGQMEMRSFEALSTTIRWKLVREEEQTKAAQTWAVPYRKDGTSYVSADFNGVDHFGVDTGSYGKRVPALAAASGLVTQVFSGCDHDYAKETDAEGRQYDPCGSDRSYGNYVVVQHANGLRTLYAHLSRTMVAEGDRVEQGDMVGYTGSTGSSTAVHLHFEIRDSADNKYNPRQFIEFPAVKAD